MKELQTVYKGLTNRRALSFTFFAVSHLRKQGFNDQMSTKRPFLRIANLLAIMIMTGSMYATQSDSNNISTITGEIMDSLCAKAGSHDQMMHDMKSMGPDKSSCSAMCVRLGAKYVLYDSAKQAIYQLDNQDKAAEFAGRKVLVSGTLQKTKIKVASISAAN